MSNEVIMLPPQLHPFRARPYDPCNPAHAFRHIPSPSYAPLFLIERPDLYWFIASAYYVLVMVAPSSQALEDELSECIDNVWDISPIFDQFARVVKTAGVALVPTETGTGDFVDGRQSVTSSQPDKLLIALILLFSTETCWIDRVPAGTPQPIKRFAKQLVGWGAQRFPTCYFDYIEL